MFNYLKIIRQKFDINLQSLFKIMTHNIFQS